MIQTTHTTLLAARQRAFLSVWPGIGDSYKGVIYTDTVESLGLCGEDNCTKYTVQGNTTNYGFGIGPYAPTQSVYIFLD